MKEKTLKFLKNAREKYLPYNETTLKRLAIICSAMFFWILIWALVFKLGDEEVLVRNYYGLSNMTWEERIIWDIIPFNYRGTDYWKKMQVLVTVLNCFVFAPFGVTFCYIFKRKNVLINAAVCLGLSLFIETVQLFTTWGNPATEDLITNVLGCFIGYGIYLLIFKRLSPKSSVRVFSVFALILGVAMAFSLVSTALTADLIIKMVTRTL